eukprot:gene9118-10806_t
MVDIRICEIPPPLDEAVSLESLSMPALHRLGEETAQSAFGDDPKGKKKGYYDRIHATWVATQALRDRDYKIERKGNVRWKLTWFVVHLSISAAAHIICSSRSISS